MLRKVWRIDAKNAVSSETPGTHEEDQARKSIPRRWRLARSDDLGDVEAFLGDSESDSQPLRRCITSEHCGTILLLFHNRRITGRVLREAIHLRFLALLQFLLAGLRSDFRGYGLCVRSDDRRLNLVDASFDFLPSRISSKPISLLV